MPLVLLASGLISLSSCASPPPQPTVCIQNVNTMQAHCYDTASDENFRKDYAETHRYLMISPDDYLDILNFVDELISRGSNTVDTLDFEVTLQEMKTRAR